MIRTVTTLVLLAILALATESFAQSSNSSGKSTNEINIADIPEGSIIVLSTEDTDVPGYVHQRYAYNCFGTTQLVDYYGSAFDPKDASVLSRERGICVRQHFNLDDGQQ